MALNYAKTAETILNKVGGEKNVSGLTHCMTRLRFVLKDSAIPKDAEVEKIPGVIRVIRQGGQYQVVIGNEVSNVYKEMLKLGHFEESTGSAEGDSQRELILTAFRFYCGLYDASAPCHAWLRYD
ncbi:PTS transporter subunit EIIB [Lacrimispora xylanisolvens]|uniref:PTS transporter subunit EIIB n=1 Tax=Lacrimispora xylanisolvens TaxID=384636 RepID=UPI002402724F